MKAFFWILIYVVLFWKYFKQIDGIQVQTLKYHFFTKINPSWRMLKEPLIFILLTFWAKDAKKYLRKTILFRVLMYFQICIWHFKSINMYSYVKKKKEKRTGKILSFHMGHIILTEGLNLSVGSCRFLYLEKYNKLELIHPFPPSLSL